MKYEFLDIDKCQMCGASPTEFKIMGKRLNGTQGVNPSKKSGLATTIKKCTSCHLIFSDPMPIPIDFSDHYGIPPESYWKEQYFHFDKSYFSEEINWYKSLVDFKVGFKSLDIGAGIGKQMLALELAGFDTYGLEPSYPFYTRALERMGIKQAKLTNLSIEESDYPKNSFEFISFGAVLEHLYEPSNSIKKALDWLKPGGLIHIEVPNSRWLTHKILNTFYKFKLGDYVANLSPMHPPYHLYEFDLKSFIKNGQLSGYKVRDYKYYVCKTYLPTIFDPFLRRVMNRTNRGMQLCVWLTKK